MDSKIAEAKATVEASVTEKMLTIDFDPVKKAFEDAFKNVFAPADNTTSNGDGATL